MGSSLRPEQQYGQPGQTATKSIPVTVPQAIRAGLGLLTTRDRRRYWIAVGFQMATSILDLVGVLLIGSVGVLVATSIQGMSLPSSVTNVTAALGLQDLTVEALAGLCAVSAAVLLVFKSVISAYLMWRVYRFLGGCQASVASDLTKRVFGQPLQDIESRPSQETSYALSQAVAAALTGTLGAVAVLMADMSVLLLIGGTLLFISPQMTVASILLFTAVALFLQRSLRAWSTRLGGELRDTTVRGQQLIQESIAAYRELSVLGRLDVVVDEINRLWSRGGRAQGDSLFVLQVPKLAYEGALVLGGIALAAWQLSTSTPEEALGLLALFLGAALRLMPSMLRSNTQILAIRSGTARGLSLFVLMNDVESISAVTSNHGESNTSAASRSDQFEPSVRLEAVTSRYPNAARDALHSVSLYVAPGQRVALVGPTGSGKSTLADTILGVLPPVAGQVLISGSPVRETIARYPGAIAYVPQHVALVNGTVRDNVALGVPSSDVDDEAVKRALAQSYVADFLLKDRDGLDTVVGERGVRLSGGQRQRLGLARALYSTPLLVVLDEATSALDAETEDLIADTLRALSQSTTVISIAHRLATVRQADLVVYIERGRVLAQGSFDEVRELNAAFNRQAQVLGL